jgi:hypothetical protein
VVLPIAGVVLLALILGGFFGWRVIVAAQQDKLWLSAVTNAENSPGVTIEEGRQIVSFRSASKPECDADDFRKYDYWLGSTTDWDALKRCQDLADVTFASSIVNSMGFIKDFSNATGIPSSFATRLEQTRGLDGTQEADFKDTKVGHVHTTFSYDGGNGIFVQFEHKK